MDFQTILTQLKLGASCFRIIWQANNRSGLSLYRPAGSDTLFLKDFNSGAEFPWTPTIEDIFAEDWEVVSV